MKSLSCSNRGNALGVRTRRSGLFAPAKTQRIIERTLQLAIEVCGDIANHVIADRALRVPTTYADVFVVLGDAGLLEAPLRDAMIRMTQFRNVFVHQDADIDAAG